MVVSKNRPGSSSMVVAADMPYHVERNPSSTGDALLGGEALEMESRLVGPLVVGYSLVNHNYRIFGLWRI